MLTKNNLILEDSASGRANGDIGQIITKDLFKIWWVYIGLMIFYPTKKIDDDLKWITNLMKFKFKIVKVMEVTSKIGSRFVFYIIYFWRSHLGILHLGS